MDKKNASIIFAIKPPPIGGISSIVDHLIKLYNKEPNIVFHSPYNSIYFFHKLVNKSRAYKFLLSIVNIFLVLPKYNKLSSVFIFSSSGYSFLEKLLWVLLFRIKINDNYIILVDGNFPKNWNSQSKFLQNVQLFLLKLTNVKLMCQSSSWIDYYKSIFGDDKEYFIFPSTSRLEYLVPNEVFPELNKSKLSIVFIGWIFEDKGLYDFLQCANWNMHHDFTLIGPYHLRSDISNFRKDLPSNVRYLGSISEQSSLVEYLRNADIFLFPSKSEGQSVAVVEALCASLPIVAYNIMGNKGLVINDHNGFLVEINNVYKLNESLQKLIKSYDLRSFMSKNSFNIYKSQLSNKVYKDNLDKLFFKNRYDSV